MCLTMSETAPEGADLFDLDALDQDDPIAAMMARRREEFRIYQLEEAEGIRQRSTRFRGYANNSGAHLNQSVALVAYMQYRAATRMLWHYLRPQENPPGNREHIALFLDLPIDTPWPVIERRYDEWWQYVHVLRIAEDSKPSIGVGAARELLDESLRQAPPITLPVPPSLYNDWRAFMVDREWGVALEVLA
jgi:hypothetical protein